MADRNENEPDGGSEEEEEQQGDDLHGQQRRRARERAEASCKQLQTAELLCLNNLCCSATQPSRPCHCSACAGHPTGEPAEAAGRRARRGGAACSGQQQRGGLRGVRLPRKGSSSASHGAHMTAGVPMAGCGLQPLKHASGRGCPPPGCAAADRRNTAVELLLPLQELIAGLRRSGMLSRLVLLLARTHHQHMHAAIDLPPQPALAIHNSRRALSCCVAHTCICECSDAVARALQLVPRGSMVPPEYAGEAWVDSPIRVEEHDYNISAPHM